MPSTLTFAGTEFFEEPRLRHQDGHWIWMQVRGRIVRRAASRLRNASPALISTSRSGTRSTRRARNCSNARPSCWCRFLVRCTNSGCGLTEAVAFRMRPGIADIYGITPELAQTDSRQAFAVPILRILKHCAPASWSQPARWNCGATNGAKVPPNGQTRWLAGQAKP